MSSFIVSTSVSISPIVFAHSASAQSLIAANQLTYTGSLTKSKKIPENGQVRLINANSGSYPSTTESAFQLYATFQTSSKEPTKKDIDTAMMKKGFPKSDYPYYEGPNGCTRVLSSGGIFGNGTGFKPACDNHDRCYSTVGKPKSVCDDIFKAEMDKICATGTPVIGCSTLATAYYKGVANSSLAASAYTTAQTEAKTYQAKVEEFRKAWK